MFLSRKKPPLIGLDISSTSVKLMELSKTGTSYRIEGIGVEPLPANAVVEKNVVEIESVGESVKRALAKSKIKSRNVAIAVSGSSVITKKITMPANLSEEEMEGQILLEADQYIPYPLEEVNLDFQILGESADNPDTVDILLSACRSENVDARVAAVELAGLTPKIVDIEAYTIETAFTVMASQLPDEGMDKTIAVVDIGATMTSLSIIHNRELIYTREQNFGGKQLTEEIMRRYGLSYEEAGLAKRQGGLPDNYEPEVLEPFKETTAQQVSRFLQFFYSAGGTVGDVDFLMLAGGTSCLPNLAELTESHIGVPTTIANPFAEMSSSSRVNKANLESDAPSFLIAAGLAIRGVEHL
ncbi:MAG: type IV pilus assembly protein PilM [Gammaproteobacteria bacterium]